MSTAKYEIVRRLGAGGMAEVFEASIRGHEGVRRRVAIKKVLPEIGQGQGYRDLFISEAKLGARLNHANVLPVLDFDVDEDGRPFIVMDFVDGCDLDKLIDSGPVPPTVAIYIATCMLRGLGHVHDLVREDGKPLLVVHRDVSPHNVLVGWDASVRVSDWGIAKSVNATNATHSGKIAGKVAYMSPEQACGDVLDGRSDLFATGIVLHEMLTGRPLFGGEGTWNEVFARLLNRPIVAPSTTCRGISMDLDLVTMTLLARDRDQRFQHANDAVAALENCPEASLRGQALLIELLATRFPDRAPRREIFRPTGGVRTPIGTPGPRSGATATMPVSGTPALEQAPRLATPQRAGAGMWLAVVLGAVAMAVVVGVVLGTHSGERAGAASTAPPSTSIPVAPATPAAPAVASPTVTQPPPALSIAPEPALADAAVAPLDAAAANPPSAAPAAGSADPEATAAGSDRRRRRHDRQGSSDDHGRSDSDRGIRVITPKGPR